jgi:hypothetical protein
LRIVERFEGTNAPAAHAPSTNAALRAG